MLYSSEVKSEARNLRIAGFSLKEISDKTHIPITTVRTWVFDIQFSKKQLNTLKDRVQKALQEGRIKAQRFNKEKRIKKETDLMNKGKEDIDELSSRDFFIAGVALYWAEGFKNKHEHRLGFCNSDPNMIRFYIHWLKKSLGVSKRNLILRLTLNKSYEDKTRKIEDYWSQITGIPLSQFTKPFYQNTQWKKQFNIDNYHGVLRIHVKQGLDYLLKMRGWLEGLKDNLPG